MAIVKDGLTAERAEWDEEDLNFYLPYNMAFGHILGKEVADLCCGLGNGTRLMARYAKFVRGYDYSETAIEYGKARPMDNVEYVLCDIEETDIGNETVITCMQGLEHLNDPASLITKYKDRTWIFALPNETDRTLIQGHKTRISDKLIHEWFGDIEIFHFNDSGEIWLGDKNSKFTNYFGIYRP